MTYESIRLDKCLYRTHETLTNALEEIDPSSQYVGTSLYGLDAYQRQLFRFNIHVSGRNPNTVLDFFKTEQSAILFPEFVLRSVYDGMMEDNRLTEIIGRVNYGYIGDLSCEQNCLVKKHGTVLSRPFESIKYYNLAGFRNDLKQIGRMISRCEVYDAVKLAIDGDRYNDKADVIEMSHRPHETDDEAFIYIGRLYGEFRNHRLSTVVMTPHTLSSITYSCRRYIGNFGESPERVMGATIVECSSMPDACVLGIDKSTAIGMYRGSLYTDYDRLIDGQLVGAQIAAKSGFYKIDNNAAKVLRF